MQHTLNPDVKRENSFPNLITSEISAAGKDLSLEHDWSVFIPDIDIWNKNWKSVRLKELAVALGYLAKNIKTA